MRIYISGAITGQEGYRKRFKEAQIMLEAQGHQVANPAETIEAFPNGTWAEYMRIANALFSLCDEMVILPGFEHSQGVAQEIKWASEMCIPYRVWDEQN